MSGRRKHLFEKLEALQNEGVNFDDVAFFMHGWAEGIQCGVQLSDVSKLVEKLIPMISTGTAPEATLHVLLYCCKTGDVPGSPDEDEKKLGPGGDGGFADRVRDEFCKAARPWIRVYAHTTSGHTTRNPFVRTFEGQGSLVGAVDGNWMVRPPKKGRKSPLWKPWRDAQWSKGKFATGTMNGPVLIGNGKVQRKDFRFFAPYMSIEELHGILAL
ncbi:MAG: hypothetical protein JXA30_16575 [Deltaproteobacteria bacterium]|nr:hypothetical protein [Deltaproteobacteria bacterium]